MLGSEAQQFLERLKRHKAKPLAELSPQEAREYVASQAKLTRKRYRHTIKVTDIVLTHQAVSEFKETVHTPLRFYRPNDTQHPPVIFYFHGGGFTAGNADYVDPFCHQLAIAAEALVISVEYHLAPEYAFPFQIFEGLSVIETLLSHADAYRFDPTQISLMGDSAGANIAAVLTNQLSAKLSLKSQVLLYPVTDFINDYPSHHLYGEDHFLTKANMDWSRSHYLQDLKKGKDSLASPVFAENLKNIPPTLVITAEFDPLRDEGRAYAKHLVDFGCKVTYHDYKGMIHCFATFVDVFPETSKVVIEEVAKFILDKKT